MGQESNRKTRAEKLFFFGNRLGVVGIGIGVAGAEQRPFLRQEHVETGAAAGLAGHADVSGKPLHDLLDGGQAQ